MSPLSGASGASTLEAPARAAAVAAAPPSRRPLTTTERNALWGLVGTVGLFLLFGVAGAIEQAAAPGLARSQRLVYEATETVCRLLTVGHTIVATLFLVTSSKVRSAAGAARLAFLLALSAALCWGFTALGGRDERGVAIGLFTVYFLAHDLRDESWFYAANGDAAPAEARHAGPWATALLFSILLAAFGVGLAVLAPQRPLRVLHLQGLPAAGRAAIGVAVALAGVVAAHGSAGRLADGMPGGRLAAFRRHRPLLLSLAVIYATLLASIAVTGRFYALVGVHVVIWYVFSVRRIARARKPAIAPRPGSLAWMRSTVVGFNVLHIGVIALLVGLAALRAFAFRNDPSQVLLAFFTSRDAFPLWTIVHITLSWMPRK